MLVHPRETPFPRTLHLGFPPTALEFWPVSHPYNTTHPLPKTMSELCLQSLLLTVVSRLWFRSMSSVEHHLLSLFYVRVRHHFLRLLNFLLQKNRVRFSYDIIMFLLDNIFIIFFDNFATCVHTCIARFDLLFNNVFVDCLTVLFLFLTSCTFLVSNSPS